MSEKNLTDEELIAQYRKQNPNVLGATFWYKGRQIVVPIIDRKDDSNE